MPLFHRRDVLAALSGLAAFGGGLNAAWAQQAKKSLGKPIPPPRPKLIALDPATADATQGRRARQEKSVVWTIAGELRQRLMTGGRYV
jgi:hypothetical protein